MAKGRQTLTSFVFASTNPGKLAEVERILAGFDIRIVPQSDFGIEAAVEDGKTFVENALIKARHAATASGLPAIADDSGLVVDALDGAPGVHSARFAGNAATDGDNIDKLLHELEGIADERRTAAFHCAAVLVPPDAGPIIAEGRWSGTIAHARQGTAGFGYDPVFLDGRTGHCAAELTPEEKNSRSHRGLAFRRLADALRKRLAETQR